MKITFVSNYINHHQIPFCDEMYRILGDDFSFVQTMPMEEKRLRMGWGSDLSKIPYVHAMYEEEELCEKLIDESDVMILGWIGDDKEDKAYEVTSRRLLSDKPSVRVSERIYREGRWKMFSPRGLKAKYEEHIRFRNKNVYLLCAGAYVSGDFKAIGAYPCKMFKWGYFPPFIEYTDEKLEEMYYKEGEELQICFAGRLIKLKHPELSLKVTQHLKNKGIPAHLHMVGDGPLKEDAEKYIKDHDLTENVTMYGAVPPEKVREVMEKSHIMIFGSNYLEGWGAVVNEAMNSACAVLASREAGAVPYLVKDWYNGVSFDKCSEKEILEKINKLLGKPGALQNLQKNAYLTIRDEWNAKVAAKRFLEFCEYNINNKIGYNIPSNGPMSKATIYRPAGFLRSLSEDNHLE